MITRGEEGPCVSDTPSTTNHNPFPKTEVFRHRATDLTFYFFVTEEQLFQDITSVWRDESDV